MAGYLDEYGAGDERRQRIIIRSVIAVVVVLVLWFAIRAFFRNYSEKQVVKGFLSEVNAGQYQTAYRTWGCTEAHSCGAYTFQKFMEDWGPKGSQGKRQWNISDVDGCPTGVIITVSAPGAEPSPIWVQRSDKSFSFSPWPECPGRKWRFRQFWNRVLGRDNAS